MQTRHAGTSRDEVRTADVERAKFTVLNAFPVAFAHVSVIVTDVERARAFYGGVLGFVEADRPDFGFPGIWYSLGANLQLHIIQNREHVRSREEIDGFTPQYAHFALFTNDVDALCERLRCMNVRVNELYSSPTRMRQVFVKDPDGNMIEFIGPSAASEQAGS